MRYLLLCFIATIACSVVNTVSASSLKEFRWQNRIVIIQVTSEQARHDIAKTLAYHQVDVQSRKLLFFIRMKDQVYRLDGVSQQKTDPMLAQQIIYKTDNIPHLVLLIGLDGGTKRHYELKTFSLDQVFADIDLMPMRQIELED